MSDILNTVAYTLAYPTAVSIFVNGLDDLFVDLNYWIRGLWQSKHWRLSLDELKGRKQQRIAIMVPAWHEAAVIESMLRNTIAALDYDQDCYDVFVGTYCNDPETQSCVDAVADHIPNVCKVVVPHDGPTSKADCLNWVYQSILLKEKEKGVQYDILVMQDAEDVVHPLALRLYNYLVPEYEFVQTPVLALSVPWTALVGGTYLDEFTESHMKDMLVRGAIKGLVPSAGVGSAFSRPAIEDIARAHNQQIFDVTSLTEDYEIGLKFRLAGKKTGFACHAVSRLQEKEVGFFKKVKKQVEVDDWIVTREFFPTEFNTSVRQRSRWILGIGLQTWEKIGWQGPLPVLYCLWRDRKALLVHCVGMLGYSMVLYFVVRMLLAWMGIAPFSVADVIPNDSTLSWLVTANVFLMAWRASMKFVAVKRVYDWTQAFLSVLRFPVANLTAVCATVRAVKQYISHKRTGQPLRWLKTDHAYPTARALESFRRRLGELLMTREGLTKEDLLKALELQAHTKAPLGEILTMAGIISSRQVARVLSQQLALPVVEVDPMSISSRILAKVPEAEALRMGALPLRVQNAKNVMVAIANTLQDADKTRLEDLLGMPVTFGIAPANVIRKATQRAYRRLIVRDHRSPLSRLGNRLVSAGTISREQLAEAITEQTEHGELLAEIVLRKGWANPDEISRVAEGPLAIGFRQVSPEEVDSEALLALGYALCQFNALVPVRLPDTKLIAIASAFPVNDEVMEVVQRRLGGTFPGVLSPRIDVRIALALASRKVWPNGLIAGVSGMDGAELAALATALHLGDRKLRAIARDARYNARSPIEELEAQGKIDARFASRVRAYAYEIPMLDDGTGDLYGGIAPFFGASEEFSLLNTRGQSLLVATSKPSFSLAERLRSFYPDKAITWRVAAPGQLCAPVELGCDQAA